LHIAGIIHPAFAQWNNMVIGFSLLGSEGGPAQFTSQGISFFPPRMAGTPEVPPHILAERHGIPQTRPIKK